MPKEHRNNLQPAMILFKVISVRDEIVIGLDWNALAALGGDISSIGRALAQAGELTAWQFAVRRKKSGRLEQAPLREVSILAHESIRIEPYSTPLPIAALEKRASAA